MGRIEGNGFRLDDGVTLYDVDGGVKKWLV